MLFNPNYDIVLNKGKEVKEKYSEWINSFSAFVFINGLKEINHSYNYKLDNWNDTYYRWNDSTQKVWRHIKNKIVIPPERLPKINDYIFPYRDESSNSQAITNLVKRKNRYLASEYNINKKEVLKYYPDFTPPSTKYLSANNILTDIDKIKYDFFNDNFDIDIAYLSVRESYFQSQIDYKAFVDKISVYIAIFIIALLIVLLFYRKLFIVKYISKMVNA